MLGVWRQIDIVDQRVVIIVRRSLGVAIAMNVPASVFFRGKTCCVVLFCVTDSGLHSLVSIYLLRVSNIVQAEMRDDTSFRFDPLFVCSLQAAN